MATYIPSGCAFTTADVFYNIRYTVGIPNDVVDAMAPYSDSYLRRRMAIMRKVFAAMVKMVIEDIINDNATFHLPLNRQRKAYIYMRKYKGKELKKMIKAGMWKRLDVLASNFCTYIMTFMITGSDITPKYRKVHCTQKYKDQILKKINEGFQYGDGCNDKYLDDYVDKVQQLYPLLDKKLVKKILRYGWRSLFLFVNYGGDVVINSTDWKIKIYIGNIPKLANYDNYLQYYATQLARKLKLLYLRQHKGERCEYRYFAIGKKKYEEIKNKTGMINYGPVKFSTVLDECIVSRGYREFIYKVPIVSTFGHVSQRKDFITDRAEFIMKKPPVKELKDIQTRYNKYNDIYGARGNTKNKQ